MELKHVIKVPKEVETALNDFLHEHIQLQLDLYNYSFLADDLGFNGFSYWLQVQAQDEVLHQRKLMNYFFQREAEYKVKAVSVPSTTVKVKTADEILHWIHQTKEKFLNRTHEIVELAKSKQDFTTAHFMDWFLEDFAEEVDELKVLHDEYTIANGEYYKWDHRQGKREEPPTLKVIVPFYDPA